MDITMCTGEGCPAKEECLRYTAKANELRQSYFLEPPIKDGKCEMYWGDRQTDILNMLEDIVNGKAD